MQRLLLSVGKILFLGVGGYVVLNRYKDIFSLNQTQSILLVIFFIGIVLSSIKLSELLGPRLPWKESVVENVTLGVVFALFGTVYALFVL